MGVSRFSEPAGGRIFFERINDGYDNSEFQLKKMKPTNIHIERDENKYYRLMRKKPQIYEYLTSPLPPYFDGIEILKEYQP